MNAIERAALRTYLWWKNRYYAIEQALPSDNLYAIVGGSPVGGFCDSGKYLGVDDTMVTKCAALDTLEIPIRRALKESRKEEALLRIKSALDVYKGYLADYLGQEFIDANQEVFTWRSNEPT